jgi:hypothetical protein
MGWLSKLIVVDKLGFSKYKWNSAKILVELFTKKITLKLRAYVGFFYCWSNRTVGSITLVLWNLEWERVPMETKSEKSIEYEYIVFF